MESARRHIAVILLGLLFSHALGAIDVVAKPFNPMTLAGTIQSIWDSKA